MRPKKAGRLRLSVLLFILLFCVILLIYRAFDLENTTYAYTVSFGNGFGFIVYTHNYDELPPILQESIRVHEHIHLRDGTIWVDRNSHEIIAYTEQIKDLDTKIQLCKKKFKATRDPRYISDLSQLNWFRAEMIDNMNSYKN